MRVNRDQFLFVSFTFRVRMLKLLRQWVDPVGMLAAMANSNAFISGSALLLLLSDADFEPGDLDIYVSKEQAHVVLDFVAAQGYTQESRHPANQTEYGSSFLEDIYFYTRHSSPSPKQVNIITTWTQNPAMAIFDFDSTLVMNALSARYLMCFYPGMTLSKTGVITRQAVDQGRLAKYQARGFKLNQFPLTKEDHNLISSMRFGDDFKSLIIEHDVWGHHREVDDGVEDIMWMPRDVYEHSRREFIMYGRNGEGRYKGRILRH
ncbi:hypothetical protein NP233_g2236 [Leucocoprinus birnbaumii]|uniref:Uncharacterized protein n=1 Tax=Leucocoprinus birnbaumii TaxID=56174 RepID=A0AAD5YU08_9AGAR|nr:hypothetical protein NP233_g2236 [Leucocoprinus birnbaumii]